MEAVLILNDQNSQRTLYRRIQLQVLPIKDHIIRGCCLDEETELVVDSIEVIHDGGSNKGSCEVECICYERLINGHTMPNVVAYEEYIKAGWQLKKEENGTQLRYV